MHSKKRVLIHCVILLILLTSQVFAVKKLGQTGFKWLSIPVGARAAGMGSAYTSASGDLNSMFWNPAGLTNVSPYGISFSNVEWIAGINHSALTAGYDLGQSGVLAFQFLSVDYGDLIGTIRADNNNGYIETGNFSPQGKIFGIGYGRRISAKFSFGAVLKYCYEDLGTAYISESMDDEPEKVDATLSIPAFDVGTLFFPGYKDLRLGMTLQNFSQEKSYIDESFPLPLTFKFGLSMDVLSIFKENSLSKLTLSTEMIHPRDYTEHIHLGAEYDFNNVFSFRSGYKTNYDEEDLSMGMGIRYQVGK
ncbi:MAG: PorV/PorQ family protein, partial [FCB group bacterium]|nr:PorV/PorQ family protein [FCB group bacterium]